MHMSNAKGSRWFYNSVIDVFGTSAVNVNVLHATNAPKTTTRSTAVWRGLNMINVRRKKKGENEIWNMTECLW